MKRLFTLADNRRPGSLANRFRRRRMRLLHDLIAPLPRPVRILDVGGTQGFWRQMGLAGRPELEILLLNVTPGAASDPNIEATIGDGREMGRRVARSHQSGYRR